MNGRKIAEVALGYVGKTEKPNNTGFNDAAFEKKMQAVGFVSGQAWCAYFAELVCKEAYAESKAIVAQYNKLFSASATATFKNFDIAKFTIPKPVVGATVIWRHGSGWQGHAGIVTEVLVDGSFKTVEGNTNDVGGREGYIVSKKTRKMGEAYKPKGLNLVGFIAPI